MTKNALNVNETAELEASKLRPNSSRDVEAEDIIQEEKGQPSSSASSLQQFLERISPTQCLGPVRDNAAACHNPLFDEEDIEDIVEVLLKDLKNEGKLRTAALQKLYRMTDRERQQNRIPVMCTTRYDIISKLIPCMTSKSLATDRRQALLLVSNLCVPPENKAAIMLGEPAKNLLPVLLDIVTNRLPESYLATVCLFNLSFLEESKQFLFTYVPPEMPGDKESKLDYHHYAPIQDPTSLLRTLEAAMKEFLPFVVSLPENQRHVMSVEGEVIRYAMGVFRHLSTIDDIAIKIAKETIIPGVAVQCLKASLGKDLALWKRDSMEDACLMLLVRLSQHGEECIEVLRSDETESVLASLKGRGGIHETRATALLRLLQQDMSPREPELVGTRQPSQSELVPVSAMSV